MKIIRHTTAADLDLQSIFSWTFDEFGKPAVERYGQLIGQALHDLAEDPKRLGTQMVTKDLMIYHLRHSRTQRGWQKVHRPRHVILYRTTPTHVEILRYLHDAMDLENHFPDETL